MANQDGTTLPVLSDVETVGVGMQHHDGFALPVMQDVQWVAAGMQHHDGIPLAGSGDAQFYSFLDVPQGDCRIVRTIPRLVRSLP